MKTAHDLVEAARAEIREIPLDQAEDAIKEADVLLDVREADEYHTSHIPGAVNVSRGILEFKLTNDPAFEDRALNLVIYCKNSGRSALAARAMKELGYINFQPFAGGFEAWEAAGRRLVKPDLQGFDKTGGRIGNVVISFSYFTEFFVSAFQLLEVNGWHPEVLPFLGMTGEQQDLVPACSIEQDTFHVFQPVLITVHQGVVQENQGGPLGFPQQVGIGEAADQPHLFPGIKTQLGNLAQLIPPVEGSRPQVFVHLQRCIRKQQRQVMVKVFLQRGLQAPGQRLAFVRQQCEQQIQCPGAAIQLLVAALALLQLRLLLAQLLFQAFGTPGFKPNTNVPKFPLPVFLGLLQSLDRALKTVDILPQDIRPGLADLLVPLLQALAQAGLLLLDPGKLSR